MTAEQHAGVVRAGPGAVMPWLVQSAELAAGQWAIVLTHRSARLRARYGVGTIHYTSSTPCRLGHHAWPPNAPTWAPWEKTQ